MNDGVIALHDVTRVQRTFAFIDVCEFTRFTDSNGDARAVEVLAQIRAEIRRLASIHGVRIAKWLGDGAMLVGVEAEPTIEAAVAIVTGDHTLSLRAGVATGDVILFEGDDHIGQAVNLASRLCDLAGPDDVLAPRALDSSLLVNTAVEPFGEREIPGFAAPIELVKFSLVDG